MAAMTVSRGQVLRYRWRAQGLHAEPGTVELLDPAVLDLGVQESGTGGALWSLANRGVAVGEGNWPQTLALVWSVRAAPHAYRRRDLPDVEAAVRPYSPADAAKRILNAAKPLAAAGIGADDALAHVAARLREVVTEPMDKGTVSTRLTALLPDPYLKWCAPCGATHAYEMPFRLGALQAGLEREPGTSPPVLRPVPGWSPDRPPDAAGSGGSAGTGGSVGPVGSGGGSGGAGITRGSGGSGAGDGSDRRGARAPTYPPRLDPVRAYLHLCGPARPADVAGYLDAPVREVAARWPADVVDVEVDGVRRSLLAEDAKALAAAAAPPGDGDVPRDGVRLLGPFDLFLQVRDRELLVPDASRRPGLWPTLGRPGAVVVDGEIVGTWRPRASGSTLRLQLDPWVPWGSDLEALVEGQGRRLAEHRGLSYAGPAPVR